MKNEIVSRSKGAVLALLETAIARKLSGREGEAILEETALWIRENFRDVPDDPAGRRDLIREIITEVRNCMGVEDRRAYAAFFAGSIVAKAEFDAMGEIEQTEFLNGGGLVEPGLAE
jgi:hypothetical protein